MSTFATLDNLVSQKIANSSEIFYDSDMRRQESNNAVKDILERYDIPEMIIRSTITFDSSGNASKPANYYRMVKLWETDSNGIEQSVYNYIQPDTFDKLSSTAAYYWTEDYIVADAEIKLRCLPADSGTIDIRYIKKATEMSSVTVDCGLSSDWDEAIAYKTAARLMQISTRYDEAREYDRLGNEKIETTLQVKRNPGGIKEGVRIKSRFERISLLGGFSSQDNNN
jgi:hypothetical protein